MMAPLFLLLVLFFTSSSGEEIEAVEEEERIIQVEETFASRRQEARVLVTGGSLWVIGSISASVSMSGLNQWKFQDDIASISTELNKIVIVLCALTGCIGTLGIIIVIHLCNKLK